MKNYTLTFSVPARVLVRVPTTGENQQDALANGHAALADWRGATADVESVDLEGADFLDMSKGWLPSESPEPAGGSASDLWQLVLRTGTVVYSVSEPLTQSAAEARMAEALAQADAGYSHVALRAFGGNTDTKLQQVARGGWEVWARPSHTQPETLLETWLNEEAALKLFRSTVLAKTQASVRLVDFSNRIAGAKDARVVQSSTRGTT